MNKQLLFLSLLAGIFTQCESPKQPMENKSSPAGIVSNEILTQENNQASVLNLTLPEKNFFSSNPTKVDKSIQSTERSLALNKLLTKNYIIENKGQLENYYGVSNDKIGRINFYTNFSGGSIYFGKEGISYGFLKKKIMVDNEIVQMDQINYDITFPGKNSNIEIVAEEKLAGTFNHLAGSDPKNHFKDIGHYNHVIYKNIYNNIDLKYFHSEDHMKYDFIVKSGGDPQQIELAYNNIEKLSINKEGDLEIMVDWGILLDEKPYGYQLINGKKKEVAIKYIKKSNRSIGFKIIGNYDKKQDLVIDPPTAQWASYFTSNSDDNANAYITDTDIDKSGNIYFTGWVNNLMPGIGTTLGPVAKNEDIMVYKVNPTGTAFIYGTVVSATLTNNADVGLGISVNSNNEIFISGFTTSTDFPAVGTSSDATNAGTKDIIVFKLNSTASAILGSTYHGGTGEEIGHDIEADPFNTDLAYISGVTNSSGLQIGTVYDNSYAAGFDAFIAKFNASTGGISLFSYYGGMGDDISKGMAFFNGGTTATSYVYLTGATGSSTSISTAGAYSITFAGGTDAFVAKLTYNLQTLTYGTYLGGVNFEFGSQIRITPLDEAIIMGKAESFLPTKNAYQSSSLGSNDGFLAGFNSNGSSLLFSTFISGSADENGSKGATFITDQYWKPGGLDISNDYAVVAFLTQSSDIGVQNPLSYTTAAGTTFNGNTYVSGSGGIDTYIAVFNFAPARSNANITMYFGTHLGNDVGGNKSNYTTGGVKIDPSSGCFYVGLSAHSVEMPTTAGIYATSVPGTSLNDKPFIIKICDPVLLPVNLLEFKGEKQKDKVELIWLTSQEVNNSHFEILKSTDGLYFESIGNVPGNLNSNTSIKYSFADPDINQTGIYYKLKQVDIDGKYEFSKTIYVTSDPSFIRLVKENGSYLLAINSQNNEDISYSIISSDGREIQKGTINISSGVANYAVNLSNVAPGNYIINAQFNNGTFTEKIIVE